MKSRAVVVESGTAMKKGPQRDWAERAAARLHSAMLPHFPIADKCEAQIAAALHRAEKRGYGRAMKVTLASMLDSELKEYVDRQLTGERDRSEG